MESAAVHAPFAEAEAVRRRLIAEGRLRNDLRVAKDADGIWFPTTNGDTVHDFEAQATRARHYTDLLDWPADVLALAPRAFDPLGDIVVVKVPDALWDRRADLGEALCTFLGARAAFHDRGVVGAFRTRDLERIAGTGGSETEVLENGARLRIDPARAYYSPRLGDERARVTGLAAPGETCIDLFGGVAPQGVQLARAGVSVTSCDLNPEAIRLAEQNARLNKVALALHCGDARDLGPTFAPADRVIMNLPHGAKHFLDVGAGCTRPGGVLHHHEILPTADVEARRMGLVRAFSDLGRAADIETVRHVRAYSAVDAHYVFDVRLQ